MKIRVVKFSRVGLREYQPVYDIYLERMRSFFATTYEEIRVDDKNYNSANLSDLLKLNDKSKSGYVICLDERGKTFSSEAFANQVQKIRESGQFKTLSFVIGGPFGLPQEFVKKCDMSLRLSDFTMSGDLAVLALLEQLYRTMSILTGKPYHHA